MPHENILPSDLGLMVGPSTDFDILTARNKEQQEVVRIASTGKIYWLGREVTTDEEFRQTMLELHKVFKEMNLSR
jgi:hypothetical protein